MLGELALLGEKACFWRLVGEFRLGKKACLKVSVALRSQALRAWLREKNFAALSIEVSLEFGLLFDILAFWLDEIMKRWSW